MLLKTPVCKIITVNASGTLNEQSHSFASIKYFKRRKYVEEQILPKMSSILPTTLYNAVTPNDFVIDEDSKTCYFDNVKFQIGLDWNSNKYISKYLISLFLTNYKLWIESCEHNQSILILEDDLVINSQTLNNLSTDLNGFIIPKFLNKSSILYLQSDCPWRKGYPTKNYPFRWRLFF